MTSARPRLVPALERVTARAEVPVRRVVRSHRLNPLPHAGTISVFLLGVVVVSGVYITLFFGFGFEASYDSVERMADHPIQSAVRSIHRYSSAALVVTTLVHAWRIFVAGRFRGPRRWRWTSGVAALVVVWLAGVTGYWLVWDERAQALNEATAALFGDWEWFASIWVRDIEGPDAGTGWGILFVLWAVHLLLTLAIGYAIWRHVRRTRLAVLPPRHWMVAMFVALLVASIVAPADLLRPVDSGILVGDLPLDPFVLFLLPPMLSGWAWVTILIAVAVVAVAMVAPHVAATPSPVVSIDIDACTGCELCVLDCPYHAVVMAAHSASDEVVGTRPLRSIAVVDAAACVGCGICVGSCSFGAIELPGFEPPSAIDPDGRHVVVACSRHLGVTPLEDAVDPVGDEIVTVPVACTGMLHAGAIGSLTEAGATEVQIVGCAPGDCVYGLGNTILDARLTGDRAPHVPKRWSGVADTDWVATGELVDAIAHPGDHPDPDAGSLVRGRRAVGAMAVVAASVAAIVLATQAPYRGAVDRAGIRVVVDHVAGRLLEGQTRPTGAVGEPVSVVVLRDGTEVGRENVPGSDATSLGVVDVTVDPGSATWTVLLDEGSTETVLLDADLVLPSGRRLVVAAVDVPPAPGVAAGREVFERRSLGACGVCHSVEPNDDGVGPSLSGVADRAGDRVPGSDAEAYLRESVLDPDAYVVEGYRSGQMLDIYEDRLSDEQIDALVEYLLSLTEGGP